MRTSGPGRTLFIITMPVLGFFILLVTIIIVQRLWHLDQLRRRDLESQSRPVRKLMIYRGRVVPKSDRATPESNSQSDARRSPGWWSSHSTQGSASSYGHCLVDCDEVISEKDRHVMTGNAWRNYGNGYTHTHMADLTRHNLHIGGVECEYPSHLAKPLSAASKPGRIQTGYDQQSRAQPAMSHIWL